MKFLVVSNAPLLIKEGGYYSYAPYVREMEIWFQNVEEIGFCCPTSLFGRDLLLAPFRKRALRIFSVPELSARDIFRPWRILMTLFNIYQSMRWADHIHLRCPGNMGLLGSIVQIGFPGKSKTAKYAGNWDPEMRKVKTYNWQRSILSNEYLSKNISVLVYGEWPRQSRNIKPFFTASYSKSEIVDTPIRNLNDKIHCLYCGFLLEEKRPLRSIQAIERLCKTGYDIELVLLGDGPERKQLDSYIKESGLASIVHLKGNVPASEVKSYMQQSHFLTFYGHDSEGWPKVVAEAMFWGCVPLVRSVSCTRYMLGNGERGTIVEDSVESMAGAIAKYIKGPVYYKRTADKAMEWSRQYTLERFEEEIDKLIKN